MSIIVAVNKGNDMVVAADSLTTFGSGKAAPGNVDAPKTRKVGRALVASSGWGLYDNILDDYLSRRKSVRLGTQRDVFRFFLGLWNVLHEKYSFVNDQCDGKDSPFGDLDASFLVATRQRIFYVSSNMSVTEFAKYEAIGAGYGYALGAVHALYDQDLPAEEIARKAVEAAIAHDIYCGGDIQVLRP